MKTKTFRFRKYKKKNVLLQMIVSRKQVILLRNIMTDSLLFCSVGFVFMNMCDSKYKLISGEGGLGADCADYLLFFVYAIALLMIILWMTVSVLYSIAEYTSQEKQGKSKVRSYLWFFIWFFVFNCAVYFSLKTINIKDIIS
ncbi:hypothetical protein ACN73Y_004304 [Escherichia coli]|uniref:hypothetical protein n=1 Tax=Escherichia coli TaxID=562 RepID=UPI001FCD9BB1|nr:hypothetical protein [Escherichia coli]